jgi:hypothetical protein
MAAGKLHELDAGILQMRAQALIVVVAVDAKRSRHSKLVKLRPHRQTRIAAHNPVAQVKFEIRALI